MEGAEARARFINRAIRPPSRRRRLGRAVRDDDGVRDDERATRDVKFCIDRGGTFTDVYAEVPDAEAPGGVGSRR